LTSFAPSPIANVNFPNFLTSLTIYAFCFGVTRQKTIDLTLGIIYNSCSYADAKFRVDPSMTGLA
jgi:hypothetical protein